MLFLSLVMFPHNGIKIGSGAKIGNSGIIGKSGTLGNSGIPGKSSHGVGTGGTTGNGCAGTLFLGSEGGSGHFSGSFFGCSFG